MSRYFALNYFGWFTDLKDTDGNDCFEKLRTYLRDHDFKPFNAEQRAESNPEYTRVDEARAGREKEVFATCKLAEGKKDMSGIKMLTNSVFGKLMVEVAESIAYDLNNPFVVMVKK